MKKYLTGLTLGVCIVFSICMWPKNKPTGLPAAETPVPNAPFPRYCIFHYNIDSFDFDNAAKRPAQRDVENPDNWTFISFWEKNAVFEQGGNEWACQLLVDERDTYVIVTTGDRKLNPRVRIGALTHDFNKARPYYFVNTFSSPNNLFYQILNTGCECDKKF